MVPTPPTEGAVGDPDDTTNGANGRDANRAARRNDGGDRIHPGIRVEDERLYFVVREAVEDAMLGVVGTLLLVGIALVLVWAGGAAVVNRTANPGGRAIGLVLVLVGFYLAAATLDVIPPIREWL